MKPLIGWVAGVHLDDLGQRTPKVVLGTTGEFSDQHAVAIDVPLMAEHRLSGGIDRRLPLVADYCGAAINVSIKAIDAEARRVEFYAPVFPGVEYRIAAPLGDYLSAFQAALPRIDGGLTFSCNCILNFLYSGLEGKRTGPITGPMTFGEIGYQLLNQTLVYLTVDG